MTVTAPQGFVASGVHARIRKEQRDLALVRSLTPATGAAMWTQNRVLAAPVVVSKQHLELAQPQAIVVNSGVANAATGAQGIADAIATAEHTPRCSGSRANRSIVLSTGVIGAPMPMDRILAGLDAAAAALSGDGGAGRRRSDPHHRHAREDRRPQGAGFTVGGMAKGSGMIHPNLATMLVGDHDRLSARAGRGDRVPAPVVAVSFNAITVDGECSTNDAVVLLSSGVATARADAGDRRRVHRSSARRLRRSCPTRSSPTARVRPCWPRSRSAAPRATTRRRRSRSASRPRRSSRRRSSAATRTGAAC